MPHPEATDTHPAIEVRHSGSSLDASHYYPMVPSSSSTLHDSMTHSGSDYFGLPSGNFQRTVSGTASLQVPSESRRFARHVSFATTPASIGPERKVWDQEGFEDVTKEEIYQRPASTEGRSAEVAAKIVHVAGQRTGWAAMADDIRKYDEDRFKDCKDDIDTLMTFAGLFSAAITSFLVESYQILLPDNSAETLQVLRTMSRQNILVITQDQLLPNATFVSPPPASTPASSDARPSNAIVLVNVFWFASLISSLVVASFGMLVKRWLHEHLSVNNPSPQARLRLRRYREPSLSAWKVFEIAAALPFLLQLALALFFAGLCVFTASVHNTVGRTTTALVLSWAFCVVAATSLPAFFPRCPYKTAFMRRFLDVVHKRLPNWLKYTDDLDEDVVTKRANDDLDLLVDVDALQADDELLGTTILESIGQFHRPPLTEFVHFLKKILDHRCQLTRTEDPSPQSLPWPVNSDLQSLTDRARRAVRDIIGRYVCSGETLFDSDTGNETPVVLRDEVCAFLMSPGLHPLPAICLDFIQRRLHDRSTEVLKALLDQLRARSVNQDEWLQQSFGILEYIRGAFESENALGWFKLFRGLMDQYCFNFIEHATPILHREFPHAWSDRLSQKEILLTTKFLCDHIEVDLRGDVGLASRMENPKERYDSIYRAAYCALRLVPDQGSCIPPDMLASLSRLLASTLTSSHRGAARAVLEACLQQGDDYYDRTLPRLLEATRDALSSSGQLEEALPNYHTLISGEPPTESVDVEKTIRHLKLCYIATWFPSPSDSQSTQVFSYYGTVLGRSLLLQDTQSFTGTVGLLSRICLSQLRSQRFVPADLIKTLQELGQVQPPTSNNTTLSVKDMRPAIRASHTTPLPSPLSRSGSTNLFRQAASQVRSLTELKLPRRGRTAVEEDTEYLSAQPGTSPSPFP